MFLVLVKAIRCPVVYISFIGHNGVSGLGIENHTIYLDLRTPGIIRSPGFKDNDQYSK